MEDCKPEQVSNLSNDFTNNYISSIKLSNFRNYKSFKANFSHYPIAFIGKNGVGKTNILESISLMQPGRGIRSVKLEEMSYKNRGNFGVYVSLERNRNSTYIIDTDKNYNDMQKDVLSVLNLIKDNPNAKRNSSWYGDNRFRP